MIRTSCKTSKMLQPIYLYLLIKEQYKNPSYIIAIAWIWTRTKILVAFCTSDWINTLEIKFKNENSEIQWAQVFQWPDIKGACWKPRKVI